jgi:hypothetical protein
MNDSMPDEINFLDLAVLLKITPNTPLEKLGGLINASIFEASNLAGGMKQKGLIEFSANYPGPNSMTVTEAGKALIAEGDTKGAEPFDHLDDSILQQLAGGKKTPLELQSLLNVRARDLALRLYKEWKQGFLTYDLKNGMVDVTLTEKGFLLAKKPPMPAAGVMPAAQVKPANDWQPNPTGSMAQSATSAMPAAPGAPAMTQPNAAPKTSKRSLIILGVLVIILVIVFVVLR